MPACGRGWPRTRGECEIDCRRGTMRHGCSRQGSKVARNMSLTDWLALREPLDAASRSFELTRAVAAALPRDRSLRIVDLGCGTGANVRYLEPHLRGSHDWLLVDKDPSVLAMAPHQTRCLDLGRRDAPEVFAGRDLVTASALLDLV